MEKPYFIGFLYSMAAPAVLVVLFSIWWWTNRRIPLADRIYGCGQSQEPAQPTQGQRQGKAPQDAVADVRSTTHHGFSQDGRLRPVHLPGRDFEATRESRRAGL
jgi:hypothetical protein